MEEKKFFNFKEGEGFDLNEEYKNLFGEEKFIPTNPNDEKLKDAENIIQESGGKYVDPVSLGKYEDAFINVNEFLTKFKTDSDKTD